MYSVVHFELPFRDRDRAVDFYAKAFGWKATKFGPEMGNYATVETGETDPQTQLPLQPGAINGGLFEKTKKESIPFGCSCRRRYSAGHEGGRRSGRSGDRWDHTG